MGNIEETAWASNFKIDHNVGLGSLYIWPEMTSQSTSGPQEIAQTRQIGVMLGSRFLDTGSIDFEKSLQFWEEWYVQFYFAMYTH